MKTCFNLVKYGVIVSAADMSYKMVGDYTQADSHASDTTQFYRTCMLNICDITTSLQFFR